MVWSIIKTLPESFYYTYVGQQVHYHLYAAIFPICFTKALEVYDFPLPQKLDGFTDIGLLNQAKNVVVSGSCFLLCSHVFKKVGNDISFTLEFAGIERNTACCLRPDANGVVRVVGCEAAFFNFLHGKIASKLVYDCRNHFQMSQFFGAYIVLRNVPNQALCGQAQCFRLICT